MGLDFTFLNKYYWYYLNGVKNTLLLTSLALILGILLGLAIALLRLSKIRVLRILATAYIEIIRGTPLLIQIMILYYGLSSIINFPSIDFISNFIGFDSADFFAGALAVALNSGAYVAEIIRAGIQSVNKGQMEAARSLGLTHTMAMRYIIIPQAFKNILPALGNEFVTLIKETSIVSSIGVMELTRAADVVRGNTYKGFEPLLVAAALYFSITFTVSKIVAYFERRLKTSD